MNLDNFSIFDVLGMTEQELKAEAKRPLDFWVRQVKQVKDPGVALGMLSQAEEWSPEQKITVIRGMLTMNLVSFLTSNKVDFLDYDGWKKYMQENPFVPAQTLEVPNDKVVDLAVQAMKILRPKVTRDMTKSGRAPKPQKLLGQLVNTWLTSPEEKKLFFIGWAIYATVMKTQAQAGMSFPIEKKAVSEAIKPDKEVKSIEESGQLCDVNDIMARLKGIKV